MLVPQHLSGAELDACPRCRGLFIEQHENSQILGPHGHVEEWAASGWAQPAGTSRLRCPLGHGALRAWRVGIADGSFVEVDACTTCRGLWLDAFEASRLRVARAGDAPAAPALGASVPGSVLNVPPPGEERTGAGWYLFQLLTSLPLEVYNPRRRAAAVCSAIVAACVGAFVWELVAIGAGDEEVLRRFGAVRDDLVNGIHLHAVLTHMFLHGGWAHLLGNLYMLWTFGDNVEDRVGRVRFLGLYLFFGVAGLALQMGLTEDGALPLVGASGAIAGLMGAYLGLFPRAQLFQVFFFVRWKIPVWFYLGGWAALNVLIGVAELNHLIPEARVAWWAHVGGFTAGLAWAILSGRRRFGDGAELRR